MRAHGFFGERRTDPGKCTSPSSFFRAKLVYRSARNSGKQEAEKGMNAEIDGEVCEGKRKVRRRQCGADKREKKWVSRYFAFTFAGSGIDSRQPEDPLRSVRPLPLSSFSLRNGPMDERGLSFRTIVRCKTALRIVPLKARAYTSRLFGFVNIRKIKIYGGRFVIDYIPCDANIVFASFQRDVSII